MCTLARVCFPRVSAALANQAPRGEAQDQYIGNLLEMAAGIDGVSVATARRDLLGIPRSDTAPAALRVTTNSLCTTAFTQRCPLCNDDSIPCGGMVFYLQRNGELDWANTQNDLAASQGLTQLSRTEAIKEAQEGFYDRSKAEARWTAMGPEEREGDEGAIITPKPGARDPEERGPG